MQSIWCRILEEDGQPRAEHERALPLERRLQGGLHEHLRPGRSCSSASPRASPNCPAGRSQLGRYCHMADSYHIYGSEFAEFRGRFLGRVEKRTFEQRTMRYEDDCAT